MEQFLNEIRAYAERIGVSPSTVIQRTGVSGGKWRRWVDGSSSPTLQTADRLKAYMKANPPPAAETAEDAA